MADQLLDLTGLAYFKQQCDATYITEDDVPVKSVKVNRTALTPDAQKAVNVLVPLARVGVSEGAQTGMVFAGYQQDGKENSLVISRTANGVKIETGIDDQDATTPLYTNLPDEARVNALIAAAVTAGVGDITSFRYEPVATLPASGENGVIYLVPNGGSNPNVKDEYLWINKGTTESPDYGFELLGTRELDLSGYLQSTDIEAITTAEIDAITGATPTP